MKDKNIIYCTLSVYIWRICCSSPWGRGRPTRSSSCRDVFFIIWLTGCGIEIPIRYQLPQSHSYPKTTKAMPICFLGQQVLFFLSAAEATIVLNFSAVNFFSFYRPKTSQGFFDASTITRWTTGKVLKTWMDYQFLETVENFQNCFQSVRKKPTNICVPIAL